MQGQRFSRFAALLCVAAAILASCGGSQPPIGTPGVQNAAEHVRHPAAHHTPGTSGSDLLYVADGKTIGDCAGSSLVVSPWNA